jgi:hypothetical protein
MRILLMPADNGGQNVPKLSCGSLHYSQSGAVHSRYSTARDNALVQTQSLVDLQLLKGRLICEARAVWTRAKKPRPTLVRHATCQ